MEPQNAYAVELAVTDEQIRETYAVMSQLRPHIAEHDYLRLVREQEAESGYRLAIATQNGYIACVAGFRISHCLSWGKYLYVDDLVTDKSGRSTGAGKAMVAWLRDHARAHQCQEFHLDSGVQRHDAHRFYLRERMDIIAYHFRVKL